MKFVFDLAKNEVTGPITSAMDIPSSTKVEMMGIMDKLATNMPFETGVMPITADGVLSIRKGFGYEQIVYQRQAGVYSVKWGAHEDDSDAKYYPLAHPYRIIIGDFLNGNLLGVRHFFSPDAVCSPTQQLYAVNLPNTNTIGYRNTSVGWVCLYHTDDTKNFSIAERINYMIARESGAAEPYNDSNMSHTDGTRYYQNHKYPSYMWDKVAWAKKTAAEGYQWICDEKLLVPIRVSKDNDHADRITEDTDDETSYAYTLHHAMFGPYSAYYDDKTYDKPINVLVSHGWSQEADRNLLLSPITTALNQTMSRTKVEEIEITGIGDALRKLQTVKLTPIPDLLKRHTLHGYYCDRCKLHRVYGANSNPIDVWRMIGKLDPSYMTEDGDLEELPPNQVHIFDSYYRIDNAFIVELDGKWCPSCVRKDTPTQTEYYIKDPDIPVRITIDAFYWDRDNNTFAFKAGGLRCTACANYYPPELENKYIVFDSDMTAVGCVRCILADEYDDCVKDVTGSYDDLADTIEVFHVLASKNSTGLTEKFWISVKTLPDTLQANIQQLKFMAKDGTDVICACNQTVPHDYPLTVSSDGKEKCCYSCMDAGGRFCSIFSKVSLTQEGQ